MTDDIYAILAKYWQYPRFRQLQEEIIEAVMNGHDALGLMPTGGGKSLCFQVPALAMPGICIVITPLIALMKDQVENLKRRKIEAVAVFSGMQKREIDITLDNCIYGPVKFLYLSPERLMSELVRERIKYMKVNLIAVDEAHCISQWGYDFRPQYLHIAEIRALHPNIPILALTATATARVVEDIQEKLAFRKRNDGSASVFRKSFMRQNLAYMVLFEENKMRRLLKVIAHAQGGSGIIYVRNRRETQEVCRYLLQQKVRADYYHAGLETPVRSKKQDAWKNGSIQVIVSTNAFGMGIDKPDVRFVVHLDIPETLEAYFQEAGRAGRDGEDAYAVMLYNEADKLLLKQHHEASFPTLKEIAGVYYCLGNYFQLAYGAGAQLTFSFDLGDFCNRYDLNPIKAISALKFLERDEYIALTENVYLPSRLRFETDSQDLYRFQVAHANLDHFIKAILRAYGGAFDYYIKFNEEDLARKTGLALSTVKKNLHQLEQYQVITYYPKTDKPQLQFLQSRVDTQHLSINREHISERKRVSEQQLHAVLNYLEFDGCRSIKLLKYLDEYDSKLCGKCDFCLRKNTTLSERAIEEEMVSQVVQLLNTGSKTLDALVENMHIGTVQERIELIRSLLDTGKIKVNGDHYYR